MKIQDGLLVTGCAGSIGFNVARLLLEGGRSVVGMDNLNDYYDHSLKRHRIKQLKLFPQFQFVTGDLEDRYLVDQLFDYYSFDTVINLAARAGVRSSMLNPHVYFSTNVMGSLNLLEAIQRRGIKKYVLASTSSLYAGQEMPFVESLPVNTPISPYAASKKAAETLAYTYHHLHGIDVSICRYFTVYGPGDRPDMAVFRFIKWIYEGIPVEVFGDGSQSRDFTFVEDIARGTIAASKPLGYEIINIGGGNNPIAINDLIAKLEELLGKKAIVKYLPFHKADMKATWADISKAKRLLQWEPQIDVDQGLKKCVDWWHDNLPWSSEIQLPHWNKPSEVQTTA